MKEKNIEKILKLSIASASIFTFVTISSVFFEMDGTENQKLTKKSPVHIKDSRKLSFGKEFYSNQKMQFKLFTQLKNYFDQDFKSALMIYENLKKDKINIESIGNTMKLEINTLKNTVKNIQKMNFIFQNHSNEKKSKENYYQKHLKWDLLSLYLELELFYDTINLLFFKKDTKNKIFPPELYIKIIKFKNKNFNDIKQKFYQKVIIKLKS